MLKADYMKKYLICKRKYDKLKARFSQSGGRSPLNSLKLDEIFFWSRQFGEHAEVIENSIGMSPEKDFAEAGELKKAFGDFWKKYFAKVPSEVVSLEQELGRGNKSVYEALNTPSGIGGIQKEVQGLVNRHDLLCKSVKKGINDKIVQGWIFPELLDHMLMESSYFNNKLTKKSPEDFYPEKEELDFWNDHSGTEMGGTAKIVKDSVFKDEAKKLMEKEKSNKQSFVKDSKLADKYLNEILDFAQRIEPKIGDIKRADIPSIVAQKIAIHNGREFNRNAYIYNKLKIRAK